MEEDSGVKAPVTRLRRRLSVEQSEDVKSPAPATPTKKRGGRLAAKPQLDLIDENAPTPGSATKRSTRKTSVKDIADAEDKPATPSRRSTRIKSNTSIVADAEEKPATPLRRTARIKSNTSIVSETTQSCDSPRAKRAARRTSQVGSDSEASVTPARATRRTRKDSASSVEKLEDTLASKPGNITEVIIEEADSSSLKSDDTTKATEKATEVTPSRRSPRIKGKKQAGKTVRKSVEGIHDDANHINNSLTKDEVIEEKGKQAADKNVRKSIESNNGNAKGINNSLTMDEAIKEKGKKQPDKDIRKSIDSNNDDAIGMNTSTRNDAIKEIQKRKSKSITNLSVNLASNNALSPEKFNKDVADSSFLMVKELDKKPRKVSSSLNKSTSAIENDNFKTKRQRTKSWTITSQTEVDDGMFYSDNENVKKKLSKKQILKERKESLKHMGSGDHPLNNTENEKSGDQNNEEKFTHNTSVEKNTQNETSFSTSILKGLSTPKKSTSNELTMQTISPQGNKENIETIQDVEDHNASTKIFEKSPAAVLQSTVLFEDSDTDSKGKEIHIDTEDQCVPVIDNELVKKQTSKTLENDEPAENISVLNKTNNFVNDSCEPMDVDETIPNNVSLIEMSQKSLNQTSDNQVLKGQEFSVIHSPQTDQSLNQSKNKSRRKSSLTNSSNQNLEKTENKSTLILSHIKDVSATEHNTKKSPKVSNELLSKSVCSTSLVKEKVPQDYSTSTPLQQKKFQKLGLQINSSMIDTSAAENKQTKNKSKNELSQISKSSKDTSEAESEDEVDSSRPSNSMLDDEAEEASDDYESGDSRDDEEREYERNNEIVEKGETLDSDEEGSNDTDYEKDSFVVSSDEEDNELLSGSGDDLTMSDNELTMSKKSKNKYNERKSKDQKKASREMYEARHNLDSSDASLKSRKPKRQKIESSDESSDEENIAPVKRNKLRLDSTQDESLNKSNPNESKLAKKSKRKRLSESVCDENANIEHEITINRDSAETTDPLSAQVKLEPKTPIKDMDISTVQINDNIEEVSVENNLSVMRKTNETVDPLQATLEEEEESSSMSENSEIMNNYDSVLKELNNDKPKTIKSLDMSLNLDKKVKQNKQPIIDQLNITGTKRTKKMSNGNDEVDSTQPKESKKMDASSNDFEDSSSSDFIDMQLLFSEDSNDCDTSRKSIKNAKEQDTEDAEDFIPLKRTPGKMNILNTEDTGTTNNESLNESVKNKRRSSKGLLEEQSDDNAVDNNDIHIIIDTQGTHGSANKSLNISQNTCTKKKKNKKNVSLNDAELYMLNVSSSKKEDLNESTKSKKKFKKSTDTQIEKVPGQPQDISNKDCDAPEEVTITKSKKKNRKSSDIQLENVTEDDSAPEEIPYESTKNKSSETLLEAPAEEEAEKFVNVSLNVNSAKKKKKHQPKAQNDVHSDVEDKAIPSETSVLLDSTKKKKKKLSVTLKNDDIESSEPKEEAHNISSGSTKKKKHKVKPDNEPEQVEETNVENVEVSMENSKKRKRKSSANQEDNVPSKGCIPQTNDSVFTENQKKKRKIAHNEDHAPISDSELNKKNKKRKEREDDDGDKVSKMFKVNRLPTSIIKQLDDKPKKEVLDMKKSSIVSTTPFIVEDTRKRRNKPSAFLEESVYLNDTYIEKKKKVNIKKPKVLPFIPTAVTSGSGFTTNFKINIIPQEVQFVAQTKNTANFKNDYLYGKKIKRLGTYETYKKHRSAKMAKF